MSHNSAKCWHYLEAASEFPPLGWLLCGWAAHSSTQDPFTHQITILLQRILKDMKQELDEEIHMTKSCTQKGASGEFWAWPGDTWKLSGSRLEALWTSFFWVFIEALLHGQDQLNHWPWAADSASSLSPLRAWRVGPQVSAPGPCWFLWQLVLHLHVFRKSCH